MLWFIAVGAPVLSATWLIVRKAIALLLMPVGLLWFGLVLATFVTWRRRQRLRWLLATLLIGLTIAGNPWVVRLLMGSLEAPYASIRPFEADEVYDAVFVLGGGSSLTFEGAPQLGGSGDRIRLAAALYHAGKARILVTTGSGFDGRSLAAETKALWSQLGVPGEAVVMLAGPLNTSQEIEAIEELLAARPWQKVGLVTSARHMRRAQLLARQSELELDSLPADFRAATIPLPFLGIIPQASALYEFEAAAWEYMGALSVQYFGF